MAFKKDSKLSNDKIESEGRDLFKNSLPSATTDLDKFDGKKEGYDEHLELLTSDGQKTGKSLYIQSKATRKNITSYRCKPKLLNACVLSTHPVLLVLVNIETRKAYWELMDKAYIEHVLKGKKVVNFRNSLNLDDIDEMSRFVDACSIMCDEHLELFENEKRYQKKKKAGEVVPQNSPCELVAIDRYKSQAEQQLSAEELGMVEMTRIIENVKQAAQPFLDILVEKLISYQGLIYLTGPVYLGERGKVTREKIRAIIGVNRAEEEILISHMLDSGFLKKTGDLVFILNTQSAKACAKTLVDTGKVDLDKLIEI